MALGQKWRRVHFKSVYKEAIMPQIATLLCHPRLHHALSYWMAEFSPLKFSKCDSKITVSYLLDHEDLSLEYVPSAFLPALLPAGSLIDMVDP